MTDHKKIENRLLTAKNVIFFCLILLALPGTVLAQDFVLPDFGDTDPKATTKNDAPEKQNAQNADFDFFSDDASINAQSEGEDVFEKTPEDIQEDIRKDAFNAALQGLLPLRPSEIRALLEQFDRTQESVELPVHPPPKPQLAVETLALDPGTKPTTIKVAHGYVTTLNILDSTGAPWPIEDITWAGDFEVVESSGESSHFIRISPQSEFAYGNMSIHLSALQTPIIISLETNRDVVHYRFDAIIPQTGPFAKAPIIQSGISTTAGDVNISAFLEGVLPKGAKRLSVSGLDGRTSAYSLSGVTYLRTPLVLLSPAWTSSASSADGMHVYAMKSTPVLLLSNKGQVTRARLSSRKDVLDE